MMTWLFLRIRFTSTRELERALVVKEIGHYLNNGYDLLASLEDLDDADLDGWTLCLLDINPLQPYDSNKIPSRSL